VDEKPSEMSIWLAQRSAVDRETLRAYRDGDKAPAEVEALLRDAPRVVTSSASGKKQSHQVRSHWALPSELRLLLDD
jgi:hypothetical protein